MKIPFRAPRASASRAGERALGIVRACAVAASALGVASLASACSGGGDPAGTGSGASSSVSWTQVYGEVLTQCTDHHSGGANAAGSLDLSTKALAFANLVRVPAEGSSCGVAALDGGIPLLRVDPGHSDDSLLYQKLVGTQTCGAIMPDLADPLPASQIALIKSWIDEGAPNN